MVAHYTLSMKCFTLLLRVPLEVVWKWKLCPYPAEHESDAGQIDPRFALGTLPVSVTTPWVMLTRIALLASRGSRSSVA